MASGLGAKREVEVIGAAFCEGQNLAGADAAPGALRKAGLVRAIEKLGWSTFDEGDLDFAARYKARGLGDSLPLEGHHQTMDEYHQWEESGMSVNFSTWAHNHEREGGEGTPQLKPGAVEATSEPQIVNGKLIGCGLELVHEAVSRAVAQGRFALTLGGDHSIAAGSISAMCKQYPRLGVVWIDAHADANTPTTSPSLHYHGMPAAHLMGWFSEQPVGFDWLQPGILAESNLAYIGLRDIDPDEARLLKASKVTALRHACVRACPRAPAVHESQLSHAPCPLLRTPSVRRTCTPCATWTSTGSAGSCRWRSRQSTRTATARSTSRSTSTPSTRTSRPAPARWCAVASRTARSTTFARRWR
jgi:arginase family enzyme